MTVHDRINHIDSPRDEVANRPVDERGSLDRRGVILPAPDLLIAASALQTDATVLTHDAHFHSPECGHHARWHDGHCVYYYGDQWEYYDPYTGRWYSYRE